MTETVSLAEVEFRVEEEQGRPIILVDEVNTPGLSILRHGYLLFDLALGVTRAEAEQLAAQLNGRVHAIVYVGEDPDEED